MNYQPKIATPPPAQNNERLSRVKELAVITATEIVKLNFAQRQATADAPTLDILKEFVDTYREIYDELTYVPED